MQNREIENMENQDAPETEAAVAERPTEQAVTTPPAGNMDAAATAVTRWRDKLVEAGNLACDLTKSTLVPAHFRNNLADAAVVIMRGAALGLDPLQAMESIYVVKGRTGMYARAMLALVLKAGHEVVVTEADDTKAVVKARRKGGEFWQTFTWTIERATKAGYTSNAKYKSNPQEMLIAKATAEACRVIAPDLLLGIDYTLEEHELEPGGITCGRGNSSAGRGGAITPAQLTGKESK